MPAYVYILRCRDESLYTGWTNDLEKRLEAHNSGKGAKYEGIEAKILKKLQKIAKESCFIVNNRL